MIPKFARFQIENQSGVTLNANDVSIQFVPHYIDANTLKDAPGAEQSRTNSAQITSGAVASLNTIDNTNLGLDGAYAISGHFAITTTGTPNGDVIVYYQISEDGADWPDDKKGLFTWSINFTAAGTLKLPFVVNL